MANVEYATTESTSGISKAGAAAGTPVCNIRQCYATRAPECLRASVELPLADVAQDPVKPSTRRILALLSRHRKAYALGVLCLVATNALNLAIPWLLKVAFDGLEHGKGSAF